MAQKPEHLRGNSWRVRRYVGINPTTGKPMQRGKVYRAVGIREATRLAIPLRAELEAEVAERRARAGTLGALVERYEQVNLALNEWSPSTARRYHELFATIVADLGHIHMADLTSQHVDMWYVTLLGRKLSPQTVTHHASQLRAVLRQGEKWGVGTATAVTRAKLPRIRRDAVTPPTPAVVKLLLDTAKGDLRAAVCVSALAGLRRGEVVGLRWSDFDGSTLTVSRAVLDMPGGEVFVKAPKSNKPRRLTVDDELLQALEPQRVKALRQFAALGVEPPADWFVFANLRADPTGQTPMRPGWYSLAWSRHRDAHGAPTVALHHLRHWNASSLIAEGTPIPVVQARLGHADITTTGRYTHAVGAGDTETKGRLSALLERPQAQENTQ